MAGWSGVVVLFLCLVHQYIALGMDTEKLIKYLELTRPKPKYKPLRYQTPTKDCYLIGEVARDRGWVENK